MNGQSFSPEGRPCIRCTCQVSSRLLLPCTPHPPHPPHHPLPAVPQLGEVSCEERPCPQSCTEPTACCPRCQGTTSVCGCPNLAFVPSVGCRNFRGNEAKRGHLSLSAADSLLQSSDTSPLLSPSPTPQPSSLSSSPSPSPSPSLSPSPSHEGTPQTPRHRLAQVLLHTNPLSPSLGGEPPPNTPSPPLGCPGKATGSPALSSSPSSRQDAQEQPGDADMDT